MSFYTFGVDLVMTSMLEMFNEHVNCAFIFDPPSYQQPVVFVAHSHIAHCVFDGMRNLL